MAAAPAPLRRGVSLLWRARRGRLLTATWFESRECAPSVAERWQSLRRCCSSSSTAPALPPSMCTAQIDAALLQPNAAPAPAKLPSGIAASLRESPAPRLVYFPTPSTPSPTAVRAASSAAARHASPPSNRQRRRQNRRQLSSAPSSQQQQQRAEDEGVVDEASSRVSSGRNDFAKPQPTSPSSATHGASTTQKTSASPRAPPGAAPKPEAKKAEKGNDASAAVRSSTSSPSPSASLEGATRMAAPSSSSSASSPSEHTASPPAQKEQGEAAVTWRNAWHSPRNMWRYSKKLAVGLWEGAKHFWTGSKLLAADVRVSARIVKKIVAGRAISRRERNLLVSTGADLARLLPFSFFLIVPFMEFALPFALRLFPNMLPRQFQDELKREETAKSQLKVRLEMARYFQDVVGQRARTVRDSNAKEEIRKEAEQLFDFLEKIRSGEAVEERQVFRFARFFNDEITIDGAVRPQLVAMCKYLGIATYGSDAFLRFKIRSKLNSIKNDDMQIMWEGGVDSLTDDEMVKACQDRGIRTIGISKRRLRRQLGDWLEMSQDKEVPSTLMILSRAFFYTDIPENALRETLSSLPDDVVADIKVAADRDMTSAKRLAELKRQERLIAMEEQQESKPGAEKADGAAAAAEDGGQAATSASASDSSSPSESSTPPEHTERVDATDLESRLEQLKHAVKAGEAALSEGTAPEEISADEKTRAGLLRIADVLHEMHLENPVERETLELEELKATLQDVEARITDDGEKSDSQVRRLKSSIEKLEREVHKTQEKLGVKMKLLDADKDGVIHIDEVLRVVNLIAGEKSEELIKHVLKRLDENNDGRFTRDDLARLRREIRQEVATAEASAK